MKRSDHFIMRAHNGRPKAVTPEATSKPKKATHRPRRRHAVQETPKKPTHTERPKAKKKDKPKPGSRHWKEPESDNYYLYFDLGANQGKALSTWLEGKPNCMFWAWEPNPHVFKDLEAKFGSLDQVGVLYQAAVGDSDTEEVPFYLGVKSSYSSTLLDSKVDSQWPVDLAHPVMVPVMDWPAWFQENIVDTGVLVYGTVVVKMDIEGMEYRVLQRMLDMDLFQYIAELRVEYHPVKFSDFGVEDIEEVTRRVEETDCKVVLWA